MSHGRTIARNALWLTLASTGQKLLAFITFTMVARLVGVEVTGKFFYAVSVTSVFVILTDLGLTPVVIRELAADAQRGWAVFRKALRVKLLLIIPAVLASLAYAKLTHADEEIFLGVALACFVMSADAVSLLWYGVLRGRRQLKFEAIGMFAGQIFTAAASIWLALSGWRVKGLVLGLLAGSAFNLIWSIVHAKRIASTTGGKTETGEHSYTKLIRAALPFAFAGIFVKIYSYTDTLLLKEFHNAVSVGYYAVAYKLTYAFQFIPLTFVAALYPSMSAAHAAQEKPELQRVFQGSLRFMMLFSAPIAASLSALAPKIIPLVYGKAYLGSVAPLSVLPWVLMPIFLDFPVGSLLNATHRAGQKTLAMGIAMAVNVAANFALVPSLGPLGAASAGLITFILLFAIGAWFARKDFESVGWLLKLLMRGLIAAGAIWFVVRLTNPMLSVFESFVLAALAGFVAVIVTGLLKAEDVRLIKTWSRPSA